MQGGFGSPLNKFQTDGPPTPRVPRWKFEKPDEQIKNWPPSPTPGPAPVASDDEVILKCGTHKENHEKGKQKLVEKGRDYLRESCSSDNNIKMDFTGIEYSTWTRVIWGCM